MRETRLMMDMPITVEILGDGNLVETIKNVYEYFNYIDEKFSTYKKTSEISKINRGELKGMNWSQDMKTVLKLCEQTKQETNGYFDIAVNGKLDPSGLVKGWAIYNAAKMIKRKGFDRYFVDAGGDIEVGGKWRVGIRNPFNRNEVVKVIEVKNCGVATSGTYIRGQHVYNPFLPGAEITDVVSLTVIGPNVYEADRFATAAFAMGISGIGFIEKLDGFEGYIIDKTGVATYTSKFNNFVVKND